MRPTFTNPLTTSEPVGDPWLVFYKGFYYLTGTFDTRSLRVWKSPTLAGFERGQKVTVWTAPSSGPQSAQVWAPEMHHVKNRWYLYYTASDGIDSHHRHYVLESEGDDPLGPYRDRGRVDPARERYAIDGSLLTLNNRLYFMYADDGLRIAPMESPLRVNGPDVRFSQGQYDWEHSWHFESGKWSKGTGYWIEAPTALYSPKGKTFVAYSAGHTGVEDYYLGLLRLDGPDPMDPKSWYKYPEPILGPYHGPDGAVLSPGHNSFFKSPDGRENWIAYHARDPNKRGGMTERSVRAQPFTWGPDDVPRIGKPIPSGVRIPAPSGEPDM